jgi:hypothetical protein
MKSTKRAVKRTPGISGKQTIHVTWGNPSNQGIGPQAGQITSAKFFQNNTPDARFLQLSLKYTF